MSPIQPINEVILPGLEQTRVQHHLIQAETVSSGKVVHSLLVIWVLLSDVHEEFLISEFVSCCSQMAQQCLYQAADIHLDKSTESASSSLSCELSDTILCNKISRWFANKTTFALNTALNATALENMQPSLIQHQGK